jgi:hypothetical protein
MAACACGGGIRTGAQRFKLGGRVLKFCNHLAIALPDEVQVGILRLVAAIQAASPGFVLALDPLVMALDPIEAFPEPLIQPDRLRLVERTHRLPATLASTRQLRYE